MALTDFLTGGTRAAQVSYDTVAFVQDRESRELLARMGAAEQLGRLELQKGGVREATRFVPTLENAPRLLIVDITGMELPVSEVDTLAEVCEPSMRVVVVGDRDDIGLFRSLLRLGIADYLQKPLNPGLLTPYLAGASPVALNASGTRNGKLVVVAGARGGVGTSTVAANLAWHLANHASRRVVLVDLDLHGQALALQLDLGTGGLLETLRSADQLDPVLLDTALLQHSPRLSLLNGELAWTESFDPRTEQLGALIKELEKRFHFVVVDLPRRPGPAYSFVVRRADVRLFVANRTLAASHDLLRMLELAESGSGRSLIVLNDDRPLAKSLLSKEVLADALGRKVDHVIPYSRQVPGDAELAIASAATAGSFSATIADLAADLVGQRPPVRSGLRRFFKGRP